MSVRYKYLVFVLCGLTIFGIWSCGKEDSVIDVANVFGNAVKLRPWNLPTLDTSSKNCYELWLVKERFTTDAYGDSIITVDAELSLGRFLWDRNSYKFTELNGQPKDSVFRTPNGKNIYDYNIIEITVEPLADDGIRSLNGLIFDHVEFGQPIHGQFNFLDGVSEEAVYHFGDNMQCSYSVRVHSRLGRGEKSASGIWFCSTPSLLNCPVGKSMVIPVFRPEAAFTYEGWVEIAGNPSKYISTGKFKNPNFEDWSNPYIQSMAYPNLPGEDFLVDAPAGFTFPMSLITQGDVYITIEPYPDPEPDKMFPFVMFSSPLPTDTLNICGTTEMDNGYNELPQFDAIVLTL